jgi:hypothetical protein
MAWEEIETKKAKKCQEDQDYGRGTTPENIFLSYDAGRVSDIIARRVGLVSGLPGVLL